MTINYYFISKNKVSNIAVNHYIYSSKLIPLSNLLIFFELQSPNFF